MASGIDQAHLVSLINGSLMQAGFVPSVGAIHLRLMLANGNSVSLGTEVGTGGTPGYVPGTGAPVITFASTATYGVLVAGAGAITNTLIVTLPGMQAVPSPGVTGIELWDQVPARKWWGALAAPKIVNQGDTLTFAAGSVIPQIAG